MSDVRAAIEAADKAFMEAINRGDVAEAALIYTADARVLPPNVEILHGRQAALEFWQGAINMGVKEVVLEIVEVVEGGEMASEIGKYTLTIQPPAGEAITDRGKYLVVWKQEEGTWKIDIDIWNSSLPPAG